MDPAAPPDSPQLVHVAEALAESLANLFESPPELLPMIQQILAARREPSEIALVRPQTVIKEIETVLDAVLWPEYQTRVHLMWHVELEQLEREHPDLVRETRTRIEQKLSANEKNYANTHAQDRRSKTG